MTKSNVTQISLFAAAILLLSIILGFIASPSFTSHLSASLMGDIIGHSTGRFFVHLLKITGILFLAYLAVMRRRARK